VSVSAQVWPDPAEALTTRAGRAQSLYGPHGLYPALHEKVHWPATHDPVLYGGARQVRQ
jgi:hypothetical protein